MPTVFRPRAPGKRILLRASPRERGYDSLWDRKARSYRQKHPFCEKCEQAGRLRFGAVLDHKFPVQDGGEIHCSEAGVWHLCARCHGWKLRMETLARRTGQMERIVEWCDNPASRPRFRGELDAESRRED
jgi:5-methylcytosine-specific restriction endonuclease McrA